jgi:hypothetical protein
MPARPRGGVVTQRSAKPFTPVQFRAWPPALSESVETDVNIKSTEARWCFCVLPAPPPRRPDARSAQARAAGGHAGAVGRGESSMAKKRTIRRRKLLRRPPKAAGRRSARPPTKIEVTGAGAGTAPKDIFAEFSPRAELRADATVVTAADLTVPPPELGAPPLGVITRAFHAEMLERISSLEQVLRRRPPVRGALATIILLKLSTEGSALTGKRLRRRFKT